MKTLIIGGGLQGLCTALVLQQNNLEVEILESRENICLEASYANGGMLTSAMSEPWNSPGVYKHLLGSTFKSNSSIMLPIQSIPSVFFWGLQFLRNSSKKRHAKSTIDNYFLSCYSIKKTSKLRKTLNLNYKASACGTLKIFSDLNAMVEPLNLAVELSKVGLNFNKLNPQQVLEKEPALQDMEGEMAGGLYFPDDECGDANLFCHCLMNEITKNGGIIRTNTSVTKLVKEKGSIVGVETDRGTIKANNVVVTAGVQTQALMKGLCVNIPIRPVKGYSLTLPVDTPEMLPKVAVVDDALHTAVSSIGNSLRVVGSAEFAGFDSSITQKRIDDLYLLLEKLYPNVINKVDRESAVSWAGLRPVSSDGKPFIGGCDVKGLYFNVGHGHLGWTMAMGSAHMLADIFLGKTPELDSQPFRIGR